MNCICECVVKVDILFYIADVRVHFTVTKVGYIGIFYQIIYFFWRKIEIYQNGNGAEFLNCKKEILVGAIYMFLNIIENRAIRQIKMEIKYI